MDSKVVDLADDAGEDKDAEPDKVESTAKKPRVDASPAFVPAAATDTPGALHEPGVVPIGYQLALPMVTITACDEGKVSPSNRIEGEVAIGPGGSLWRMRVFPSGCSTSPPSCIGVFVAPKEIPPRYTLSVDVKFVGRDTLTKVCKLNEFKQNMNCSTDDHGYPNHYEKKRDGRFVTWELWGYVAFDRAVRQPLSAYLTGKHIARKHVGMVGIRNQGATCYLNSLLQTLFHTRLFRKAVYEVPLESGELLNDKSVVKSLQQVFYDMETAPDAISTKHLTQSFGWTSADSFQQHDVQELLRVLTDHLEEKMKGGVMQKCIPQLLQGKVVRTIRCKNVPFSSVRCEEFMDIQLSVKGCPNIMDSFRKYVEVESLEGDNRYSTEQYGLQDAECHVKFSKLPPVLHLHLKRFEFNTTTYAMEKVNSRFEFYDTIDLSEFIDPTLDPGTTTSSTDQQPQSSDVSYSAIATAAAIERATTSDGAVYKLHSVLVHSGGVGGGHYYAFVRPNLGVPLSTLLAKGLAREEGDDVDVNGDGVTEHKSSGDGVDGSTSPSEHMPIDFGDGRIDLRTTYQPVWEFVEWFKFDDSYVVPCSRSEAIDENFGTGGTGAFNLYGGYSNFGTSAYMLVYVKESAISDVMFEGGLLSRCDDVKLPPNIPPTLVRDDSVMSREVIGNSDNNITPLKSEPRRSASQDKYLKLKKRTSPTPVAEGKADEDSAVEQKSEHGNGNTEHAPFTSPPAGGDGAISPTNQHAATVTSSSLTVREYDPFEGAYIIAPYVDVSMDVPRSLVNRAAIIAEEREKARILKEEAENTVLIHIVRECHVAEVNRYISAAETNKQDNRGAGFNGTAFDVDFVDIASLSSLLTVTAKKFDRMYEVLPKIAQAVGLPMDRIRAWVIETGKGHTLRPHTYIHPNPTQDDIVHSVGGAQTVFNSTLRQHTLVYVEELPVVDEELTVGVDAPTWTTQSLLSARPPVTVTRGGLSHLIPNKQLKCFGGCNPVHFGGGNSLGIVTIPQSTSTLIAADAIDHTLSQSVLLFVRLFEPHLPLGEWPGLYVGSVIVPLSASVGQLRELCAQWIGYKSPNLSGLRLAVAQNASRIQYCIVLEQTLSECGWFHNGATVWLQPDFLLSPGELGVLGIGSNVIVSSDTHQSAPHQTGSSHGGGVNYVVGTPESSDNEEEPDNNHDGHKKHKLSVDVVDGDAVVPRVKRQMTAYSRYSDDDTQEYIPLGSENSPTAPTGVTIPLSQPQHVSNHTDDVTIKPDQHPPQDDVLVTNKAVIGCVEWSIYNASIVDVVFSPLVGSDFGSKLSKFELAARSDPTPTPFWDFTFATRLSRFSKVDAVVGAVSSELEKHSECQFFMPTEHFPASVFPRDFIKISGLLVAPTTGQMLYDRGVTTFGEAFSAPQVSRFCYRNIEFPHPRKVMYELMDIPLSESGNYVELPVKWAGCPQAVINTYNTSTATTETSDGGVMESKSSDVPNGVTIPPDAVTPQELNLLVRCDARFATVLSDIRDKLKLPVGVRLRGWLGNPCPSVWIRPEDLVSDIDAEMNKQQFQPYKIIVEVEPGNEPSFPNEFELDGSEKVEWIMFTHFKTLGTSYVDKLAERCVFVPVKANATLESVVLPCLARLGKSLDHMLMSGRGLFSICKSFGDKIEYASEKGQPISSVAKLFPVLIPEKPQSVLTYNQPNSYGHQQANVGFAGYGHAAVNNRGAPNRTPRAAVTHTNDRTVGSEDDSFGDETNRKSFEDRTPNGVRGNNGNQFVRGNAGRGRFNKVKSSYSDVESDGGDSQETQSSQSAGARKALTDVESEDEAQFNPKQLTTGVFDSGNGVGTRVKLTAVRTYGKKQKQGAQRALQELTQAAANADQTASTHRSQPLSAASLLAGNGRQALNRAPVNRPAAKREQPPTLQQPRSSNRGDEGDNDGDDDPDDGDTVVSGDDSSEKTEDEGDVDTDPLREIGKMSWGDRQQQFIQHGDACTATHGFYATGADAYFRRYGCCPGVGIRIGVCGRAVMPMQVLAVRLLGSGEDEFQSALTNAHRRRRATGQLKIHS